MSSRMAVCGHAAGLDRGDAIVGSTAMRRSASASSVVKMSLVTTTMLTGRRRAPAQGGDQRGLAAPTGPPMPIRSGRAGAVARIVSSAAVVMP